MMGGIEQAAGIEQVAGAGGESLFSGAYLLYILAFLGVLLFVAWLTRWLAGKTGKMRGRYLNVIDSMSLGTNRGLYLVLLADRLFLIGTADRSVRLLAEIDEPGFVDELIKKGEGSPFQHNKGFFQCLQRSLSPAKGREDEWADTDPAARKVREKITELKKNPYRREDE